MLDETRVRALAYELWERRVRSGGDGDELGDWLAAERQEFAHVLAERLAKFGIQDEVSVFDLAQTISELIARLTTREQRRRGGSFLLAQSERFQDLMTRPEEPTDAEARELAACALRLYRVGVALRALYPEEIGGSSHSLEKEFGDLFSNSQDTHETALFSLSVAAIVQRGAGRQVEFLEESREPGVKRPDFKIPDLAYFECKKVQSHSRDNVTKSIDENLEKAAAQLGQEQGRAPLPFAGACVELPLRFFPPGPTAFGALRSALEAYDVLDFVVLTVSGVEFDVEKARFPIARTVMVRAGTKLDPAIEGIGPMIQTNSELFCLLETQEVPRERLLNLEGG